MKRYVLVTAIVAAMVLTMVGSAFAFSDVSDDAGYASDFTMLEEVGVYQGYADGTAKPDQAITRAEFAAVVVRALDKESVADAVASYETSFTDDAAIADWARGYVIVANSLGIINGYPDGSFQPANNVTYAEAIAMLTRALKLDQFAMGSWPTSYSVLGADIGLTDDVNPIANLPITRGEMATMTANAMLCKYTAGGEDNDELVEELTDDETLLGRLDEDVYGEYGSADVAGTMDNYMESSQRIEVSGELYQLALDDEDNVAVDVTFNDGAVQDFAWDADTGDSLTITKDDEAVLTLNSDDKVTDIAVMRDTYDDTFLTAVTPEEDETYFGTVEMTTGEILNVDDDAEVLLDGEEVSLAELEAAFDDFQDDYGTSAYPIVTARTEGDDNAATGACATYVSVVTSNIVAGEVTAIGNDGDAYVRIDGEKVYYDDVALTLEAGTSYTLLLDSDDVAVAVLESVFEEDRYFAKVVEYELDSEGALGSVVVEKADGTEVTLTDFVDDDPADFDLDPTAFVGGPILVYIDGHGDADFPEGSETVPLAEGTLDDYSSTWIQVAGDKYVRDSSVFVFNMANEEFIELDDVNPGDYVGLFAIDGVVSLLFVDLP